MTTFKILTILGTLATLGIASPIKRWFSESIGANYFQTNGLDGNQLVSSYIMPNGSLVSGSACWTYGKGSAGINDPDLYQNHPDPFYGSGSVTVSDCQVFVVNAGSNSVSVFDIDPSDPGRPTFATALPSHGDFPISLAASPDGKTLCVLNGGANNCVACYEAGSNGWKHNKSWDRALGLNLTTPPHGPIGGTPSQLTFMSDMSALIVLVKGQLPTDLNNPSGTMQPGYVATYTIQNGVLANEPIKVAAAAPFSITEDIEDKTVFFMSDVTTGYAAIKSPWVSQDNVVIQGSIPMQAATCWSIQSPKTKSFYVVDIAGKSNITEISLDTSSLTGDVLTHHGLGVNSSGTDISLFSGKDYDWIYVNAPAYQSIHTFKISGQGNFELIQRYTVEDMSADLVPTKGFSGQAVFYKPQ